MIGVQLKKNDDPKQPPIKARYDGQDFEFKPGVTVALSEDAATHIFGYGMDDKARALIRLGWLVNSTQYEAALARLDDIQFFAEGKVVFDEPAVPEVKGMPTAAPGGGTLHIPKLGEAAAKK